MGKTQKPLTIGVTDPDLLEHPRLKELAEKGHTVELVERTARVLDGLGEPLFDLILGPRAWYIDLDHLKYLDVALKAARKTRYPKEGKS